MIKASISQNSICGRIYGAEHTNVSCHMYMSRRKLGSREKYRSVQALEFRRRRWKKLRLSTGGLNKEDRLFLLGEGPYVGALHVRTRECAQ